MDLNGLIFLFKKPRTQLIRYKTMYCKRSDYYQEVIKATADN